MCEERAIQPDKSQGISHPGQASRLIARGRLYADRPRRRLIDLGTLGGHRSEVTDMNNRVHIVGFVETHEGNDHAFFWESGRMHDLGTFGGPRSEAQAINNRGQVVGSAMDHNGHLTVFLWEDGQVSSLGLSGGMEVRVRRTSANQTEPVLEPSSFISVSAEDTNDRGQVVGDISVYYMDPFRAFSRGFMWDYGELTIFNDVVPWVVGNTGVIYGHDYSSSEEMEHSIDLSDFPAVRYRNQDDIDCILSWDGLATNDRYDRSSPESSVLSSKGRPLAQAAA